MHLDIKGMGSHFKGCNVKETIELYKWMSLTEYYMKPFRDLICELISPCTKAKLINILIILYKVI